jgi:hypothetical protein
MNIYELNGSVPHAWDAVVMGVPLAIVTILIPLSLGTIARIILFLAGSRITRTVTTVTLLASLYGSFLYLSTQHAGSISIPILATVPELMILSFCVWKWRMAYRSKIREELWFYSGFNIFAVVILVLLWTANPFGSSNWTWYLYVPSISVIWSWEHRETYKEWTRRRKAARLSRSLPSNVP